MAHILIRITYRSLILNKRLIHSHDCGDLGDFTTKQLFNESLNGSTSGDTNLSWQTETA